MENLPELLTHLIAISLHVVVTALLVKAFKQKLTGELLYYFISFATLNRLIFTVLGDGSWFIAATMALGILLPVIFIVFIITKD